MKAQSTVKTWEKTKQQNLVRHKSGGYYARLYLNGKEVWRSLKTKHYSIAESRLSEALKDHKQRKARKLSSSNGKMTFKDAATLRMAIVQDDVSLKRRSRAYWTEIYAAISKSWPDLGETEVRKLTVASCREWAAKFAKKMGATRYNATLSFLEHVLNLAIESGVMVTNPAHGLPRKPVRAKKLELPTLSQFSAFIAEMRTANGRFSLACADLAEGLAFTGCRISEAGRLELRDLDFKNGEIFVKGDPEEATKNGEVRRVPMIPSARILFDRIRTEREGEDKTNPVFNVRECQKAMTRAAKRIGMTRITHHDLRHFFATVCIESGVDIPTVSRWLGHKDGGALAMKTYGHLRREHSISQAQKVSFAPTEAA